VKTVLLADDHAPTREHLRARLTQAGYTVLPAGSVHEALELFSAHRPAAAVVAVELPRHEGTHLAPRLRALSAGGHLPLVAIDRGHLGRARGVAAVLDLKVNAYVEDPLKGAELTEKLSALLASAASREAAREGLAATLSRPPVATGELKGFALASQLLSLHRLERDGVLVVAHRDLSRRVFFRRGMPVNYDSSARQDTLPLALRDRGVLTDAQVEAVQRALAGGMRIGAALSEAGVELTGEDLLGALRDFTREKVGQVVGMREGRWAFYAGGEFQREVATVEVPALAPVLDGVRRSAPLRLMMQALRPHLQHFPQRTAGFSRDLPALALSNRDLKIAMQINGRVALSDLLAHGRGDLGEAASLLWVLTLAGDVTYSPQPAGDSRETLAPRRRKPLPPDVAGALREQAVNVIAGSYFRVLGLSITAGREEVERAYRETAQRFHPDSYAEFDLSDLEDLLESVQDKLTASYRVLASEERRRAYVQYLLSRLDVARETDVNVDAEIALKRGEEALRRKDLPGARAAFEQAVTLNPREPEYYSHLAWATYLDGGGPKEARAREAQRVLRKALSLNPYLERAQVISAIIEEEQGEHASARKRLLKVLEMNPASKLARAALRKVGR
jgi:DNA-binding response OmpR family regulator/tetratricopeptide (TPR) repeat protein